MNHEKRLRILNCAATFFTRFGFRKTSIAEIAKEARVAKGTIYLAAQSKQDLFFQVLHGQVREGLSLSAALIDPRRPAPELLPLVISSELLFFDNKPLVRQLITGQVISQLPNEAVEFDALRDLARQSMVEVLRLGIRQGHFRDDLDPEVIAELLQDLQVSTLMFSGQQVGLNKLTHPRWHTTLDLFNRGLDPTRDLTTPLELMR